MLYLEDYVEMIEHLPQELRDRFTEMREMDLGVQNNMDTLEKRVRVLFGNCRRNEISSEQANIEFNDIKKGYNRTLEEADEKVSLATQMYELVDRYLRRLDTEIYKIKCELEADNKGITEVLEKRSLELDMPVTAAAVPQGSYKDSRYRQKAEKRRDSWGGVQGPSSGSSTSGRPTAEGRTLVAATAPLALSRTDSAIQAALSRGMTDGASTSMPSYNLGHVGAGTAIAAAASQAIAATQQMQHGRRTASLKASYEAINAAAVAAANNAGLNLAQGVVATNPSVVVGGTLHTSTHHELHNTVTHHSTGHHSSGHHTSSHHSSGHHSSSHHAGTSSSSANKRHKKKAASSFSTAVSNVANLTPNLASTPSASRSSSPSLSAVANSSAVTAASLSSMNVDEQLTDGEWSFDPNEPRYCVCNQVSYGDMVACDNEDCPFEWFHYPCVGITAPPKGKWYCPQCNSNIRRNRGNRKN